MPRPIFASYCVRIQERPNDLALVTSDADLAELLLQAQREVRT
jgi:hypothetical protein